MLMMNRYWSLRKIKYIKRKSNRKNVAYISVSAVLNALVVNQTSKLKKGWVYKMKNRIVAMHNWIVK